MYKKIDFSFLTKSDFTVTVKKNVIFNIKNELKLLFETIDELSMMELFNKNNITNETINKSQYKLFKDSNWQEFKIKNIFNIYKGERLVESDRIDGETPLITASSINNGITSFIDFDTFVNKKKLFENQITIDMFGSVFYHNYKYFSDDNIHTLLFKKQEDQDNLNEHTQIFITTILKQLSVKYGYGRQVRIHRLENEIIKLPIITKNIINWQFIKNYVESLPYSKSL